MPAPFADATADAVRRFKDGPAPLQIAVTRGPLDTEALSDLASSSLLLGDTPFDVLLVGLRFHHPPTSGGQQWIDPFSAGFGLVHGNRAATWSSSSAQRWFQAARSSCSWSGSSS